MLQINQPSLTERAPYRGAGRMWETAGQHSPQAKGQEGCEAWRGRVGADAGIWRWKGFCISRATW